MAKQRVVVALREYRVGRAASPIAADAIRCHGDADQMTHADGLRDLEDAASMTPSPVAPPNFDKQNVRLWVITNDDLLHAPETCGFGACREAGVVKHSNLTGGAPAFSGGELCLDEGAVLFNGKSGRYGLRSLKDTEDVGRVFVKSGYVAWHSGWDEGADRPVPLGAGMPPVQCV